MLKKREACFRFIAVILGITLVVIGIWNFSYCVIVKGKPLLLFLAIPGFLMVGYGCGLINLPSKEKKTTKRLEYDGEKSV